LRSGFVSAQLQATVGMRLRQSLARTQKSSLRTATVFLETLYGAFTIGISGVGETRKYIQGQAAHHRKISFKEELEVFLKKHELEYVEQDLE
jgi:hypothetical protein